MFDKAEIVVKAGDGGGGLVSFRREKFVPFGGPDGGDGGEGGDVIVAAEPGITSLNMFRKGKVYRAGNGRNGESRKKHGRSGKALILTVPVGTVVLRRMPTDENVVVADLEQPGQQAVIALGGRGGKGNTHFALSTNQAPRIAQKGESGEENSIVLELRLIADVGIIGHPNAGKSTLLAAASAARPDIAGYPFTTRVPVLGVVESGLKSLVLAEIPGLIDGAHLGRGLGHDFLRHITRTRMMIHLVDGSSASPVEDMIRVNAELGLFDSALPRKLQIVVVNKIDLPEVRSRLAELTDAFGSMGITPLFISALTEEGVAKVMAETMKRLQSIDTESDHGEKMPEKVFRPQPKADVLEVRKEDNAFIVVAPDLERIVAQTGTASPELIQQLKRQLARRGAVKALEKAGVKPGDKVRCGNLEWEW